MGSGMFAQAKMVIDYLGGAPILWLILVAMAGTQLAKILISMTGRDPGKWGRPVPYIVGTIASSPFLGLSFESLLEGLACGMVASAGFAGAVFMLRRFKFNGVADWLTLQTSKL